jgi:hypothetical protein
MSSICRTFLFKLFLLCVACSSSALADCKTDLRLYNDLVRQFNTLGCPQNAAERAVEVGLLQQQIEIARRLQKCPNVTGGTPIRTLEYWASQPGEELCKWVQKQTKWADEIEEAAKAAIARLENNQKKLEAGAAGLRLMAKAMGLEESRNVRDLKTAATTYRAAAEKFVVSEESAYRQQALDGAARADKAAKLLTENQAPKKKSPKSNANQGQNTEQCKAAIAYADQLASKGEDVRQLRSKIKTAGCK